MSALYRWKRRSKQDLREPEQDKIEAARRHLARLVARLVNLRSALGQLGFRIRSAKRADCRLCEGDSIGTITFTQRRWQCHRCNDGGDIYALAQAVWNRAVGESPRLVGE